MQGLCYNQVDNSYNNDDCRCDGCNCPPPLFTYENTCIDVVSFCVKFGLDYKISAYLTCTAVYSIVDQ